MNYIPKKCKRIASLLLAVVLLMTSVPRVGVYAEETGSMEIALTKGENESFEIDQESGAYRFGLDENGTDVKVANVALTVLDGNDEEVLPENYILTYKNSEEGIVEFDEKEDKSGYQITAIGVGKAIIELTATYKVPASDENSGDNGETLVTEDGGDTPGDDTTGGDDTPESIIKTVTGEIVVEVYKTPTIEITAEPAGEAIYPEKFKFTAVCKDGDTVTGQNVTMSITKVADGQSENPVPYTNGTEVSLDAGEYIISAEAEAFADGYYRVPEKTEERYIVNKGTVDLSEIEDVLVSNATLNWGKEITFTLPEAVGTYEIEISTGMDTNEEAFTVSKLEGEEFVSVDDFNTLVSGTEIKLTADKEFLGAAEVEVTFTPDNGDNYNDVSPVKETVTIKIIEVEMPQIDVEEKISWVQSTRFTLPAIEGIEGTYTVEADNLIINDKPLGEAETDLSAGDEVVLSAAGEVEVGKASVKIIFVPSENANKYEEISVTKQIEVVKAAIGAFEISVSEKNLVWDDEIILTLPPAPELPGSYEIKAENLTIKDGDNFVSESITVPTDRGTVALKANVGVDAVTSVTVTFKPNDAVHYEETSKTLTDITVAKGSAAIQEFSVKDTIYWQEEFTFTLPKVNRTEVGWETVEVAGTYQVNADNFTIFYQNAEGVFIEATDETILESGMIIKLKANVAVSGETPFSVIVTFTPEDAGKYNTINPVEEEIIVNKVPIRATWAPLTKTYDGTTEITTTELPTLTYAGDTEYTTEMGFVMPEIVVQEPFAFSYEIAGKDASEIAKETTLVVPLELSEEQKEYYVLETKTPTVTVNKVELTSGYINDFVPQGKQFDANSVVEFAEGKKPVLQNVGVESKIFKDEFDKLSLSYKADYYDVANQPEVGDPEQDVTAAKVRVYDLKVMEKDELSGEVSESVNYIFKENDTTVEIIREDGYLIEKNGHFEADSKVTLEETVTEKIGNNTFEIYWFNASDVNQITENESKTVLTFDGYQFATDYLNEEWTDSYEVKTVGEDGKPHKIYLRDTNGHISSAIYVASDITLAVGQIYAKVGDAEAVSITELLANYKTFSKGNDIVITIEADDTESKIKTIEWYESDLAWDDNSEENWTELADKQENEFNTEADKEPNVALDLQSVTEKEQLKKFYYARITDFAGNVSYVSCSGVLQDIIAPTVSLTDDESTDQKTYYGTNVYANDVTFTMNVSDGTAADITSGVVELEAVLTKKNHVSGEELEIGRYSTALEKNAEKLFWVDDESKTDEAIDYIRALNNIEFPFEDEILKANGELKGALTGLEEGFYTISVFAVDKVGHKSAVSSVSFIIDNEAPVVKITENAEQTHFNETREFDNYFTKRSLTVTIEDITLSKEKEAIAEMITIGETNKPISWNWNSDKVEADGRIIKTAVITFGEEGNYQEGTYSVDVTVTDALARNSQDTTGIFDIDYVIPVYSVTYSETDTDAYVEQMPNGKTKYYYNRDIVATFNLDDTFAKNFDDGDFAITVKKSKGEVVLKWDAKEKEKLEAEENSRIADYILVEPIEKYQLVRTGEDGSYQLVFTIVADEETDDAGYTFEITGQDDAGNQLVEKTNNDKTVLGHIRAMDSTAPVLQKVNYDTANAFHTVDGTDYVNAVTNLEFELLEVNPITNKSFVTSENQEKDNTWTQKGTNLHTTNIQVVQYGTKGDLQTVTLDIVDKAGNKAVLGTNTVLRSTKNTTFVDGRFTDRFIVDTVIPTIKYEYVDYNPNRLNVSGIDYFRQGVTLQLTVNEHNFSSSLFDLNIVKTDETVEVAETDWVSNGDVHVKTLTFSKDNQYDITLTAHDCAKNPTTLILGEQISVNGNNTNGTTALSVAVDSTIPNIGDTAKPVIVITPEEAPASTVGTDDVAEQPLYNTDATYEVVIYDPETNKFASGIDNLIFTAVAEDGTSVTSTMAKNGEITNGIGLTVARASGDLNNLAKGKEKPYVFRVTIESEVFNSNDIILSVEAEDVSENTKKSETTPIAIDTTTPTVEISYSNNNVHNEKYFSESRIASIVVTERNFSDDCVQFVVNGSNVGLNFTLTGDGDGNYDNRVWEASYTFNEDGDYTVDCTIADRVNNTGTAAFAGNAPQEFTLDATKPQIQVSFENGAVYNEMFYDAQRTAIVRIVERNFNPEEVTIIGEGSEAGTAVTYPSISGWSSNGEEHTATITYSEDARYTLDVEYTDLAENVADDIEQSEFVVDTTEPEIIITGVEEGQSYADEVRPVISFNDNNYDSHTVELTRTERENIGVNVTEQLIGNVGVAVDGSGKGDGNKQSEDFPHEKENDGIYTLTVNVLDKAGHTFEESITFSVNRFGTVYVYSEDLAALSNGYYQSIEGDLYVSAFNADPLVEDMVKLEITCDGAMVENQNSQADVAAALQTGGSGWYEYEFDLALADFQKDGCYAISISDKDEAGNTQTNSDDPISFYKDSTIPVLDSVIGLEESIVDAEELNIQYVVSDAIALGNVAIYVNDTMIDKVSEFENITEYEGSFTISTGVRQKVRIVAEDKAGNVLDTMDETFAPAYGFSDEITVSTSALARWYANTGLFWGSIAATGGVSGGTIAFGVRKARLKLKKED